MSNVALLSTNEPFCPTTIALPSWRPRLNVLTSASRWLEVRLAPIRVFMLLMGTLMCLVTFGCSSPAQPTEMRRLERYGLTLETPKGWTGGEAGGTYEFFSPNGLGRIRVARLEGATTVQGLKESQLLYGTSATVASRPFPLSPTKVGSLSAVRAQFITKDGRLYEIFAIQTTPVGGQPPEVALIQISVPSDAQEESGSNQKSVLSAIRQSLRQSESVAAAASTK